MQQQYKKLCIAKKKKKKLSAHHVYKVIITQPRNTEKFATNRHY